MTGRDLLNQPGYFRCERLHAIIQERICVERQEQHGTIWHPGSFRYGRKHYNFYPTCVRCPVGRRIAERHRG